MSRPIAAVKDDLSDYKLKRIACCGAQLPPGVRKDGVFIENMGQMWCTDRYCSSCAKFYQQRVYACAHDAMCACEAEERDDCECPRPFLVTVTAFIGPGLTAGHLRKAYSHMANLQRRAHARLRSDDYACKRIQHWADRGRMDKVLEWREKHRRRLPDPSDSERTRREYATTYNEARGFPFPARGRTTYIWAKEVTTGAATDRWHVHFHYLVPTRADAERVNAAFQAERTQWRKLQTDISGGPNDRYRNALGDVGDGDTDPAAYITAYISKGCLEGIEPEHRRAFIAGSKNVQKYNAAGDWRPLGIGRKRDPDAVPVAWVAIDGVLYDMPDFLAGRGDGWAVYRNAVLEPLDDKHRRFNDVHRSIVASMTSDACTFDACADEARRGAIERAREAGYDVEEDRAAARPSLAQHRTLLTLRVSIGPNGPVESLDGLEDALAALEFRGPPN